MKDWIVTLEQKSSKIKKGETEKKNSTAKNCVDYLLRKDDKNHYYTEITDLSNARLALEKQRDAVDKRREARQGSGGNVANLTSSFVLGLPADLYHPTTEEWKNISDTFFENLAENLNKEQVKRREKLNKVNVLDLSKRQAKEHPLDVVRANVVFTAEKLRETAWEVVHDDRKKPFIPGHTSGSHLNIGICNVYDGEVAKIFSQKAGLNAVKKAFNKAVEHNLGFKPQKYIPYSARKDNPEVPAYSDKNNHYKTPYTPKLNSNSKNEQKYTKKHQPFWAAKRESQITTINEIDEKQSKAIKIGKKMGYDDGRKHFLNVSKPKIKEAFKKNLENENTELISKINEAKEILDEHQKIIYNVAKSPYFKEIVERLSSLAKGDFYQLYTTIKELFSPLNKKTTEYLAKLESEKPKWLRNEEIIKQQEYENNKKSNRITKPKHEDEIIESFDFSEDIDIDVNFKVNETKKEKPSRKKMFGIF